MIMILKKITNKLTFPTSSRWNPFFLGVLLVSMMMGCKRSGKQYSSMTKEDSIVKIVEFESFQELGFFGNIKENKWDNFLAAVQNNITHSRQESGNLSFSLYQPENGTLQPIWFERFKNKEAHNHHKGQGYFKDAIKVIQQSLAGEASSIELKELDEIPATIPTVAESPSTSRSVIVLFEVKPEKRLGFVNSFAEKTFHSRQAQGNLEFNVYQYADDINKFVLVESWESVSAYNLHQESDQSKKLIATLEAAFVSDPMKSRWLLQDISQNF